MESLLAIRNKYRYSINQDGSIYLYKYNYEFSCYERMYDLSELNGLNILVEVIGHKKITLDDIDSDLNVLPQYTSALVYYIRHKHYIENGMFDVSDKYYQLFIKEIRAMTTNVKSIKSEPSEYSLL